MSKNQRFELNQSVSENSESGEIDLHYPRKENRSDKIHCKESMNCKSKSIDRVLDSKISGKFF